MKDSKITNKIIIIKAKEGINACIQYLKSNTDDDIPDASIKIPSRRIIKKNTSQLKSKKKNPPGFGDKISQFESEKYVFPKIR